MKVEVADLQAKLAAIEKDLANMRLALSNIMKTQLMFGEIEEPVQSLEDLDRGRIENVEQLDLIIVESDPTALGEVEEKVSELREEQAKLHHDLSNER